MKHIFLAFILFASGMQLFAQDVEKCHVVVPRDTSFAVYSTYVKEAKKRPYIKIVKPSLPDNVKAYEGLVYSSPYKGRTLLANLYRPKDDKKYPALIMVHGGGWNSGNLSMEIPLAQKIASEGYVTIPIEYRLSSEALYPAAVYDLKTAVRWVRANADRYGIDTTRIAISGESAGGQLANLIGATNYRSDYEDKKEYVDYSSAVHAVINVDGVSDMTDEAALQAVRETLAKNKVSASHKWFGVTYDENREPWIAASPVFQVSAKAVPVCFINSAIDRFHDGRDVMIEKLTAYDIYTEVHSLPDTPHPFWLFDPWFDTTVGYMVGFLNKVF